MNSSEKISLIIFIFLVPQFQYFNDYYCSSIIIYLFQFFKEDLTTVVILSFRVDFWFIGVLGRGTGVLNTWVVYV